MCDNIAVGEEGKRVALTAEEQAWLKTHPNIELGYPDAFEPAVIVNEDGSYRGTLVDVLALLNQRLGTDFKLTVKTIPDIISQVSRKELGGVLSIHPGHADKYGWLKTKPYMNSYPTVFTRKGFTFTRPSDLAGKKIALIDKIFFSQKLVDLYGAGSTLIKVKNGREGLERVRDGAADLYIGSSRNSYLLGKYQFFDLVPAFQFYEHSTPNVMAVRDDWPQLVSILNKGLAAISAEEIESILQKWIRVPEQKVTIEFTDEEQTWLAQNHTVRVRMVDWPPYLIVKDKEPPQGIAIEYLKLIRERTGITFDYEVTDQPFAEFLESMKQRQGPDMTALITPTPAREKYLSFSKAYIFSPYVIFAREQDEMILDISGIAGKTLAVPRGFTLQEQLTRDFPEIRIALVDTDEKALQAVATGQADAYIGNLTVAGHIIHQRGFSDLRVVAPGPFGDQSLSMGNRSDWPELTSIIDKALASITEEEKTAIRGKYVALRYEQGINRAVVLKWIVLVFPGAFGVVFFFVFWNRALAKRVRQRTIELESTAESLTTEIEERNQTEKALIESEEQFRALVEQSPVSVQVFSPDGQIVQVNQSWKQLWGISEESLPEVIEIYNILEDDEVKKLGVLPYVEKAFKGESVTLPIVEYDASATLEDIEVGGSEGKKRWVQSRFYPVKNKEGEIVNVVGIEEDMTERKQAEGKIQQYQNRLKALATQLTLAEEKERRLIAVDLHDNVGHSLALARMQLSSIPEAKSDLEKNILVKDVSNILLAALKDVRSLIFELSSPSMNELGLAAAISEWLEDQIEKRHGLKTEFSDTTKNETRKKLDENMRALLFRNVRELLTNVVKHARATKVTVQLTEHANWIEITVSDDGVGFDPVAQNTKRGQSAGFGLFSIQERMTDLGGSFDIQSEPGKGCRVVLTVPVER